MTDDKLAIKRAAEGDAAAFNQLVRLHESQLRAFLRRLTGGRQAIADDLAQETFLHAWRKIRQFRSDGSFIGWLLRIAWSRYLMEMRRRKGELDTETQSMSADPREHLVIRLDLERAIARLAPPERAALTLCYALGYSHTEAASILEMPLGTLKSHAIRARDNAKTIRITVKSLLCLISAPT